jgi:Flp pilus assembly protein TadG
MIRLLRRDDGRVSLFFAIAFLAAIVLIGLSVDGSGRFRALARANNIAAEAARAAGQAINAPQAVTGGVKIVDRAQAAAAAQAYLTAAGIGPCSAPAPNGCVQFGDDDRHLSVTVTINYTTLMLSIIGRTRVVVTGRANAELVTG